METAAEFSSPVSPRDVSGYENGDDSIRGREQTLYLMKG